jgi:hypothetical protein
MKEQLTQLIEAYAVAKATGNQLLTQSAATGLIQFIESIEISKPKPAAAETDGGQE